jgi:O-antigen ligase
MDIITTFSLRKVFSWIIRVYLFLTPFLFYQGYLYAGSSSRSVILTILMGILGLFLGTLLLFSRTRMTVLKSLILLGLGVYGAVLVVSAFWGADPSTSFWSKATRTTGLFYLSHLALLYIVFVYIALERSLIRSVLQTFVVSASIFSIGYLIGPDGFGWIYGGKLWDGFTFANSTFAAMYLYAAFMIAMYLLFRTERSKRVWWQYAIPVFLVINPSFINPGVWKGDLSGGIIGESFASTYALLFSLVYFLGVGVISKVLNNTQRKKVVWSVFGVGVIAIAAAVSSLITDGGLVERWYRTQSSGARPIVWALSKQSIAERPVLGWGPDNFELAYTNHYDTKVLEVQNGAEPWFDRAHNIVIDQTVDIGYLGVSVYLGLYLLIIALLVHTAIKSTDRDDVMLSTVLIGYFVFHFAELQTAFETSISYIPLALMAALATVVVHRTRSEDQTTVQSVWIISSVVQKALGIALVGYFGWALFWGSIPIAKAQRANGIVRTVGSTTERLALYDTLFGSPLDPAAFLWRTSTDFQRGIMNVPETVSDPKKLVLLSKELDVFIEQYEVYLSKHPNDVRSHLSLADLYIFYRLFGVDKLDQAHRVLDQALVLNPSLPQIYRMKAVAYLYQAKFAEARRWAQKGLAINPSIEESQKLVKYIDTSIKNFPEIDLYFFQQI